MSVNYCPNCGTALMPNAKFCQNCGAPIKSTSTVDQARSLDDVRRLAHASTSVPETILGVILLRKPKSLGRYDTFAGVLTTSRMIFAQITKEMLNEAARLAKEQAKAEGKGFWGQWVSQLNATLNYMQKYLKMEPAAILNETPGNFALNNDSINEIKLKLKQTRRGEPHLHEFEVEVSSTTEKIALAMDDKKEYVDLLKAVYGERVKTPIGYLSGFKIHL
ncbi:MAG: zinc ribbon domain-containing protein [Nitrososphaerales archaeon]